jgi:hypothetical protein
MKGFITRILIFVAAFCAFQANAQRINPTNQIKKSPGNAPGYVLKSNGSGELVFVLDAATQTGTTAPSGAPTIGSSGIYANTTTGQIFTWNGSGWVLYPGITNLSYIAAANTGTIVSDTGNDAIIPGATTSVAGLMTATDKTNFDAIDNIIGVAPGSTNLGTFTGGILPNNSDIKTALQSLATNLGSGGQSENGISGAGSSADKYRLGGALTQNTTIDGANFGFTLNNAGTVVLESDNTSGTVRSELLLASSNIIGSYLRSVNKSNTNNVAQLSLDVDGIHGLQWTVAAGQELGFLINPNTTTATSGITVATRNHALGTATAGQVLTLQSDGTVEYVTSSGGGGGSSVTTYSAGNGAIVTASNTGVTFNRTTASTWTFTIPSGVELISFDINSTASQSATAALDIDFIFTGSRPYNQDASADMTDAKVPVLTTLKKINPSTYPTTAAGNNAAWSSDVMVAGTLRISTTEFGEVSSAGANATTVKGTF